MPCRGTGRVISNLGGTQSTLPCPWCRGGGVRLGGIDAQASGRGEDPVAVPAPHEPPDAVAQP